MGLHVFGANCLVNGSDSNFEMLQFHIECIVFVSPLNCVHLAGSPYLWSGWAITRSCLVTRYAAFNWNKHSWLHCVWLPHTMCTTLNCVRGHLSLDLVDIRASIWQRPTIFASAVALDSDCCGLRDDVHHTLCIPYRPHNAIDLKRKTECEFRSKMSVTIYMESLLLATYHWELSEGQCNRCGSLGHIDHKIAFYLRLLYVDIWYSVCIRCTATHTHWHVSPFSMAFLCNWDELKRNNERKNWN